MRLLGARVGLLFTAAFGGLSASTAVTLGYARRTEDGHAGFGEFEALEASQEFQEELDCAFEVGLTAATAGKKKLLGTFDLIQ